MKHAHGGPFGGLVGSAAALACVPLVFDPWVHSAGKKARVSALLGAAPAAPGRRPCSACKPCRLDRAPSCLPGAVLPQVAARRAAEQPADARAAAAHRAGLPPVRPGRGGALPAARAPAEPHARSAWPAALLAVPAGGGQRVAGWPGVGHSGRRRWVAAQPARDMPQAAQGRVVCARWGPRAVQHGMARLPALRPAHLPCVCPCRRGASSRWSWSPSPPSKRCKSTPPRRTRTATSAAAPFTTAMRCGSTCTRREDQPRDGAWVVMHARQPQIGQHFVSAPAMNAPRLRLACSSGRWTAACVRPAGCTQPCSLMRPTPTLPLSGPLLLPRVPATRGGACLLQPCTRPAGPYAVSTCCSACGLTVYAHSMWWVHQTTGVPFL